MKPVNDRTLQYIAIALWLVIYAFHWIRRTPEYFNMSMLYVIWVTVYLKDFSGKRERK